MQPRHGRRNRQMRSARGHPRLRVPGLELARPAAHPEQNHVLLPLRGALRILGGKQISKSAKRHPARDGSPQQHPSRNDVLTPMWFVHRRVIHSLTHGSGKRLHERIFLRREGRYQVTGVAGLERRLAIHRGRGWNPRPRTNELRATVDSIVDYWPWGRKT